MCVVIWVWCSVVASLLASGEDEPRSSARVAMTSVATLHGRRSPEIEKKKSGRRIKVQCAYHEAGMGDESEVCSRV
jgi:hypothetical protein